MMFLDQFFDVWSYRCAIESHLEQLTLKDSSLAAPLGETLRKMTHHCSASWQR